MTLLETERLLLREMDLGDLDALHEVLGDADSMRYYPAPFDRDQVSVWIERQITAYGERGHGLWGVISQESGALIGDCGLAVQHPVGEEEIEVGWHIHPAHQRRGYATEAALSCIEWGFEHLAVDRLVSMIRPENIPSRGVARNVGMTPRFPFDYKGMRHDLWVIDRPEY